MNSFDPIQIRNEFCLSPSETLFDQQTVAIITCRSLSWCERMRWQGGGIPFSKIGRKCLYKKIDIINWLNQHQKVHSTSEYENN